MYRSSEEKAGMLQRALWIGGTYCTGQQNSFGAGQEGWILVVDRQQGLYVFSPDQRSGTNKDQVLCRSEHFLTLL